MTIIMTIKIIIEFFIYSSKILFIYINNIFVCQCEDISKDTGLNSPEYEFLY